MQGRIRDNFKSWSILDKLNFLIFFENVFLKLQKNVVNFSFDRKILLLWSTIDLFARLHFPKVFFQLGTLNFLQFILYPVIAKFQIN